MSARSMRVYDDDEYEYGTDADVGYLAPEWSQQQRSSRAQVGYQAPKSLAKIVNQPTDDIINSHGSIAKAGHWVDKRPIQTIIIIAFVALVVFGTVALTRAAFAKKR